MGVCTYDPNLPSLDGGSAGFTRSDIVSAKQCKKASANDSMLTLTLKVPTAEVAGDCRMYWLDQTNKKVTASNKLGRPTGSSINLVIQRKLGTLDTVKVIDWDGTEVPVVVDEDPH